MGRLPGGTSIRSARSQPAAMRSVWGFGRRLKLTVGLVAAIALLGLAGLRGGDLWARRTQTLMASERRAAGLALILSQYLREALSSTDAALQQLALHGRRIGGPAAARDDWMPALESSGAVLTGVGAMTVVDGTGRIRHSTQPRIVGESRADQYVFKRLSQSASDELVADAPFRQLVAPHAMVVALARRLSTADGAFDGIVVASVLPERFRPVFQAVDLGRDGRAWIFHPDGWVLLLEPSPSSRIGETAIGTPLFDAIRHARARGTIRMPLAADGTMFRNAFVPIEYPPLMAAVSLSEAEALAEWRREFVLSASVFAFFAIGTAVLLHQLFRQIDRRARVEQALVESQRLEAIGRFTGGVAHDFNNMLTVIIGNVSLLRTKIWGGAGGAGERLQQIEEAARRAADLTNRMLAFARQQPLQPRIADLNTIVRGLQPMLARLLGESIRMRPTFAPVPCLASVDVAQLESAIINLCINARDAMPEGGILSIETASTTFHEADAHTGPDVAPGRYVTIAVSDTGVGISRDDLQKVVEPFFTTKGPRQGTGLGLSTVYGFVKQSGGHTKIYSEVGQGTLVRIAFPEVLEPEAPVAAPAAVGNLRARGETVLLVEDEELVRQFATDLLRGLGYTVMAAPDAEAALALAAEAVGIDLLLTDVILPRMNGRELAERLTEARPGLRVLYASGYSEDIVTERGRIAPGLNFIPKPYTRTQLAQALRDVLSSESAPT